MFFLNVCPINFTLGGCIACWSAVSRASSWDLQEIFISRPLIPAQVWWGGTQINCDFDAGGGSLCSEKKKLSVKFDIWMNGTQESCNQHYRPCNTPTLKRHVLNADAPVCSSPSSTQCSWQLGRNETVHHSCNGFHLFFSIVQKYIYSRSQHGWN